MSKTQSFELWNLQKNLSAVPVLAEQLSPSRAAKAELSQVSGEARESNAIKTEGKTSLSDSRGGAQDICQNRHRGNPLSVKAFETVRDRLSQAQARVYVAIKNAGERGATNSELCVVLGLTPNQVSPRLTELYVAGRIDKIGTRLTRSRCSAAVWRVR